MKKFQSEHRVDKIPLFTRSKQNTTLLLEEEGRLLGVCTTMRNDFHPDYDRLYFSVPDYDFVLVEALYQQIDK